MIIMIIMLKCNSNRIKCETLINGLNVTDYSDIDSLCS